MKLSLLKLASLSLLISSISWCADTFPPVAFTAIVKSLNPSTSNFALEQVKGLYDKLPEAAKSNAAANFKKSTNKEIAAIKSPVAEAKAPAVSIDELAKKISGLSDAFVTKLKGATKPEDKAKLLVDLFKDPNLAGYQAVAAATSVYPGGADELAFDLGEAIKAATEAGAKK